MIRTRRTYLQLFWQRVIYRLWQGKTNRVQRRFIQQRFCRLQNSLMLFDSTFDLINFIGNHNYLEMGLIPFRMHFTLVDDV